MASAKNTQPTPLTADSPSKSNIVNEITHQQLHGEKECLLEYENIDHKTALAVISYLREENENRSHKFSYNSLSNTFSVLIMPNQLHEAFGDWINVSFCEMIANGWMTVQERISFHVLSSPDDFPFIAPYQFSHKEPDLCVIPHASSLPTIVCECGWSESKVKLVEDMKVWLIGGKPTVQLVLIIKFSRLTQSRVSGYVEAYARDQNNVPQLVQKETIFPAPSSARLAAAQVITITNRHLWGPYLPSGRNFNDSFSLSINLMRYVAKKFIRENGCVPA